MATTAPAVPRSATKRDADGSISRFIRHHFRHFNAATLVDAADAYRAHLDGGGKMFMTIAGAMSTAELGVSLAEMIRQDKVQAITCTGANLEEDIFNLVAHDHYERVPNYRDLTPQDEADLLARHMNRVTDTCIPEMEAMRRIEKVVLDEWMAADKKGERLFPHQFMYRILKNRSLEGSYQIDPRDSWMIAAAEKNLPMFVPGWEDSTLGNMYAGHCIEGDVKNVHTVRTGIEYMMELAEWYTSSSNDGSIGFFQIGGGIAGDFPICVVPMLHQDLQRSNVPVWGYFCQISDSTTSYGSYSGAVPNEKITWGKLAVDTPKFVIESDASIVAPLIFAVVLGW
jgi:deoxyhypusine synthase